jgi:undecaprenyl-diphosphatase
MDPLQAIVLALLQGLTEFLPISSSAHLALFPRLAGVADQGLAFDVAVHVGTLGAVCWYFRGELVRLMRPPAGDPQAPALRRLAACVILGTIPVALAGLLMHDAVATMLRSVTVIAWASIGFGLLLWAADRYGPRRRDEYSVGWRDAVLVGLAQALALIPGTSRSGVTMTAALALGLDARSAARFSFLLSIPVIALAGGYETLKLVREPVPVDWGSMAIGVVVAGASAYACIRAFLALLERIGFLPFVIYRVVLGVALLAFYA